MFCHRGCVFLPTSWLTSHLLGRVLRPSGTASGVSQQFDISSIFLDPLETLTSFQALEFEQFTCGVGGFLTSSKTASLYQLPSYCTLCCINASSWSKGSFPLRAEKKASDSAKTIAWSLEGQQYTVHFCRHKPAFLPKREESRAHEFSWSLKTFALRRFCP